MHKTFKQALMWNSSATFLYKIMLLSHQILLYSVISKTLYGLQSSLFATIYTIIAVTNFGFDETLLPFFSTFSQTKLHFQQLCKQLILHIITISSLIFIFYIIIWYGSGEFLHNLKFHCNKNLIFMFMISSIFFIENLKKTCLAIMQLAFLNQQIAYAQIIMLTCYITTVWSLYGIYQEITLMTLFAPMFITSILELLYCGHIIQNFYQALPQRADATAIPFKVLFFERFYNYINQIIKTVYSPNSMTLFFAYLLGFQQAATIKFFTNIITLMYTCISKIIGVTTGATFATMNQMPVKELDSFFTDITKRYFQFLYILTSVIVTVIGYAWYSSSITQIMALQILFFFSISFLELYSITYEQLYMSQGKARSLAIINILGLSIVIPSLYLFLFHSMNQSLFFTILMTIKIISLWIMRSLTQRLWKIKESY